MFCSYHKWSGSSRGPARRPEGLANVSAGSKASLSGGVAGSHSIMSVQVKRGESALRCATACGVTAQLVSKVLVVLLLTFFFFFEAKAVRRPQTNTFAVKRLLIQAKSMTRVDKCCVCTWPLPPSLAEYTSHFLTQTHTGTHIPRKVLKVQKKKKKATSSFLCL